MVAARTAARPSSQRHPGRATRVASPTTTRGAMKASL